MRMWPAGSLCDEQGDLFPSHHAVSATDVLGKERDLFDGGPPIGLQIRLGLITPGRPNIRRRAIFAAAICWAPLALLTVAQDALAHDGSFISFATDYGTHARCLIAVPLLVAAEGFCIPRLGAIIRHFRDGGLVRGADALRFRSAIDSTRTLRDSLHLEIAVLAIAVTLVVALHLSLALQTFPVWHRVVSGGAMYSSPASWWNTLISIPLLLTLILGWLWRLVLWTRFLWLMSRLDLRLIPAHPDGAAGLKFIGLSVQVFSIIAFACGVVVAGAVINRIAHGQATLANYRYVIAAYAVVMLVIFAGPPLVFAGKLLDARRRGIFEYGALARSLGKQMERKWFRRMENVHENALATPDFSATTDLYSIVSNVYTMNIVPVAWGSVALLAIAALLPFLPAVLMSVSPEILLKKLAGLLV